jgi:hypothetical protein
MLLILATIVGILVAWVLLYPWLSIFGTVFAERFYDKYILWVERVTGREL